MTSYLLTFSYRSNNSAVGFQGNVKKAIILCGGGDNIKGTSTQVKQVNQVKNVLNYLKTKISYRL